MSEDSDELFSYGRHELTPEDAALIAGETAEKIEREAPTMGFEFATVISTSYDEGLNVYVEVVLAGSAPGQTTRVASLFGKTFEKGQRVAVFWDPPAGCYVLGTPELIVVDGAVGLMSMRCTVESGGEL